MPMLWHTIISRIHQRGNNLIPKVIMDTFGVLFGEPNVVFPPRLAGTSSKTGMLQTEKDVRIIVAECLSKQPLHILHYESFRGYVRQSVRHSRKHIPLIKSRASQATKTKRLTRRTAR